MSIINLKINKVMKELTIEEKAKAYDIALEKIKMLLGTGSNCSREELEYVFPELKESEDEKIRKAIRTLILSASREQTTIVGVTQSDMFAWLEKQYEHSKFYDSIQVGDKVTRNQDGVLVNLSQLKRMAKQGEQKPAENKGMNLVEEEMTPFQKKVFCIIDTTIEEEQGLKQVCDELFALASNEIKQKPAWSEEDEYCIHQLIVFCENCMVQDAGAKRCAHWLKSLKDRVQPQPKQEWSEEDDWRFARIIRAIRLSTDCNCEDEDWLKSIKNKVVPQSYWKPSEEQLHYLSWIANIKLGDGIVEQEVSKHLNELLEDLKKLREE